MSGKVMILGADGYLGWPTAMYLSRAGYDVVVIDNYLKRSLFQRLDVRPLADCPSLHDRARLWETITGRHMAVEIGDAGDYEFSPLPSSTMNPVRSFIMGKFRPLHFRCSITGVRGKRCRII